MRILTIGRSDLLSLSQLNEWLDDEDAIFITYNKKLDGLLLPLRTLRQLVRDPNVLGELWSQVGTRLDEERRRAILRLTPRRKRILAMVGKLQRLHGGRARYADIARALGKEQAHYHRDLHLLAKAGHLSKIVENGSVYFKIAEP